MTNGCRMRTTYEERKSLVKRIMQEVDLHKQGNLDRLTTGNEIAEEMHVARSYVVKILKKMPEKYRQYRHAVLQKYNLENTLNKQTPEEKRKYGHIGGKIAYVMGVGVHASTTEERKEYARLGGIANQEKIKNKNNNL